MNATLTAPAPPTTGYELNITRIFDAPRELVWRAFVEPEMVAQWAGPRGFRTTEFFRPAEPGGRWHLVMEGKRPGSEVLVRMGQGGVTKEFRPPELLVYTFAWDDRSVVGLGASPIAENIVTIRLHEQGGKTIMHFHQAPFATEGERDGHMGGWSSAFEKFAEFMLAEQPEKFAPAIDPDAVPTELHLKRFFAAPRDLVFHAWTDPKILAEWWGPKGFTNTVHEWDAHTGGAILLDMNGPNGISHPMGGRFVEVYPPYRFHFTASALDKDGNAMFENWNSVFLEEKDGGTEVTIDVYVLTATEAAPQYLKGMKTGWEMSLDKLADFVAMKK